MTLCNSKNKETVELSHAFRVGDDVLLCQKVYQHFGGNDSRMAEINEGQTAEEEVHGGVQVGAEQDQDDHSQVPQHCEQVDSKEEEEQGQL